ncbi:calcium-binding protein PBP1 [Sesamum indicum]|uniref:Calcium-binding protein PBP1 n=1 Tax=Sesamum indicum TaxID=4182 RepID=A0A6I9U7H1_SESIN|nr:calcium-binding protein PBP1 [Sesamum indicum]
MLIAPLSFSETPFSAHLYISLPPLLPLTMSNNHSLSLLKNTIFISKQKMASKDQCGFQDYLPLMAEKLGGDGLIGELCNGFQLLMDSDKGVITFESLKKNSALLGLQDLCDEDLYGMLREGDFDGDGALNQMEFCVLMFRLSPELMEQSQFLLEEALRQEEGFQDLFL